MSTLETKVSEAIIKPDSEEYVKLTLLQQYLVDLANLELTGSSLPFDVMSLQRDQRRAFFIRKDKADLLEKDTKANLLKMVCRFIEILDTKVEGDKGGFKIADLTAISIDELQTLCLTISTDRERFPSSTVKGMVPEELARRQYDDVMRSLDTFLSAYLKETVETVCKTFVSPDKKEGSEDLKVVSEASTQPIMKEDNKKFIDLLVKKIKEDGFPEPIEKYFLKEIERNVESAKLLLVGEYISNVGCRTDERENILKAFRFIVPSKEDGIKLGHHSERRFKVADLTEMSLDEIQAYCVTVSDVRAKDPAAKFIHKFFPGIRGPWEIVNGFEGVLTRYLDKIKKDRFKFLFNNRKTAGFPDAMFSLETYESKELGEATKNFSWAHWGMVVEKISADKFPPAIEERLLEKVADNDLDYRDLLYKYAIIWASSSIPKVISLLEAETQQRAATGASASSDKGDLADAKAGKDAPAQAVVRQYDAVVAAAAASAAAAAKPLAGAPSEASSNDGFESGVAAACGAFVSFTDSELDGDKNSRAKASQ